MLAHIKEQMGNDKVRDKDTGRESDKNKRSVQTGYVRQRINS